MKVSIKERDKKTYIHSVLALFLCFLPFIRRKRLSFSSGSDFKIGYYLTLGSNQALLGISQRMDQPGEVSDMISWIRKSMPGEVHEDKGGCSQRGISRG
jgi:hypothetical protein